MKSTTYLLTVAAMLSLCLSAAAGADNHRGRGHKDGARHQQAAPQHRDHKHRAPRREARHDDHRHQNRKAHLRNNKKHRRDARPSAWRSGKHWRGNKYARQNWRQQRARQHKRALQRSSYQAARSHRHGNQLCYLDHNNQRSTVTLWLDDIGLSVRNSYYD